MVLEAREVKKGNVARLERWPGGIQGAYGLVGCSSGTQDTYMFIFIDLTIWLAMQCGFIKVKYVVSIKYKKCGNSRLIPMQF